MKINLKALVFILSAALFAFVQPVVAQDEMEAAVVEEAVEAAADAELIVEDVVEAQTIDGKVVSVNQEEGYLVLEYPAGDMAEENESSVFYFAPEVLITQNGETLAVADVVSGQAVSISYVSDATEKNTILAVEVVL